MAYYSRQHYEAVSPRADRPEEVAWRLRDNAIREQVNRERDERWPDWAARGAAGDHGLVERVIGWQEGRIRELHERWSA